MAIWSLTKERIDKLNRQIDDKTQEVNVLSQLTPEDIWKQDLDDFIEEWRTQLTEEKQRNKEASRQGRRESKRVHVGAAGGRKRKGKDLDDSDFEAGPKPKKALSKKDKPVGGILSYLNANDAEKEKKSTKPKALMGSQKTAQPVLASGAFETTEKEENTAPADDPWLDVARADGAAKAAKSRKGSIPPATKPAKKTSAASKARILSDDDDDEIMVDADAEPTASAPAAGGAGRRQRTAAAKPVKYDVLTDSDDSDGDFDVGMMVKGIDTAGDSAAGDAASSRPLFSSSASMSRPGSSSGLGRKSVAAFGSKRDTFFFFDMAYY